MSAMGRPDVRPPALTVNQQREAAVKELFHAENRVVALETQVDHMEGELADLRQRLGIVERQQDARLEAVGV